MVSLDGIRVVTDPSRDRLNNRQLVDYRLQREDCLEWLLAVGKGPKHAEGYVFQTVKARAQRIDMVYRWVWNREGEYTVEVTHDHAEAYMRELAYGDYSNTHKGLCQKAVRTLFKWRHHRQGVEMWEPEMRFASNESAANPLDYLTMDERRKIREASLEYGTIPAYNDLSPEQRDRWKAHLAQRFEKPKSEVTPSDWNRANGWKIPSLVFVSPDAGLRPIEVERAVASWVDLDNGVLRIPREESSKDEDNWIVDLSDRTTAILGRWLDERPTYEMYRDATARYAPISWITGSSLLSFQPRHQIPTLRCVTPPIES